jgi:hypothetical protein
MTQRPHENRDPLWMKIAFHLVILGLILCLGTMFVFPMIVVSDLPIGDIMAAFRFLPSDEAMIENFHKHRKDFDRLMQIYCASLTYFGVLEPTEPEIKELMDRIGVQYMGSDHVIWSCPDGNGRRDQYTFSRKSRLAPQKLAAANMDVKLYPDKNHRSFSTKFKACSDWCKGKSNGIIFYQRHGPVLRLKTRTRVAKQYYYIPGIPKTENSVLTGPGAFRKGPLCRTLNTYPSDFMCHDCVAYREIEPHWFIRLTQK